MPNPLTRKAGPLPVWAWGALVVAAWFLFLRAPHKASGGASLPYTPASSSGAQQPASGQGTPADNTNADLLNALLAGQKSSYDALLAALQYTTAAGATGAAGVPAGFGGGGAAPTSAFTAETVAPLNNAPADSLAPTPVYAADIPPDPTVISSTYKAGSALPTYVLPSTVPGEAPQYFTPSGYFQNEQGLKQVSPGLFEPGGIFFNPPQAAAPTPQTVYSAPVDTSSATAEISYVPRAGVGKAIPV